MILLAGILTVEPPLPVPGQAITLRYKPDHAGDRGVFAHFGFNGWNLPVGGPGADATDTLGKLDHFAHRSMTRNAVTGDFELTLTLPIEARALHAAFCWNDCGSGDWDNNDRKDYFWPIVFPYIGPILTWNEHTPATSGVVVSFEHPVGSDPAWIRYQAAGQAAQLLESVPGASMHRFELTGLKAGTLYTYQVGVGKQFASAIYTFKTLTDEAPHFVLFGDAQDNGLDGEFARISAALVTTQKDADFVVSTGDLPWNDHPGDWWTFFDKGRALMATKVFMPVLGNHDTPTVNSNPDHSSFVHYFALPSVSAEHAYYRFDVGPARFFGLNSERAPEFESGGVQHEWLKRELNERRREAESSEGPLWTFVYWHIPPFNAGARHGSQQVQTRPLTRLFDGIVDWSFSGHEHLAQRFVPLQMAKGFPVPVDAYGTEADRGVGYLVVPGAGVHPETTLTTSGADDLRAWLAFPRLSAGGLRVEGFSGFARVDLTGPDVVLSTFGVAPDATPAVEPKDRLTYRK